MNMVKMVLHALIDAKAVSQELNQQ
ncbi:Protein of unknown function [Bacillus mycoides]|nr:Protein of unknown function [Bacillus mycoides]SCM91650.1 Protein of unknown function [Bacillus mycoides]